MMDQLREFAPAESVGAAAILADLIVSMDTEAYDLLKSHLQNNRDVASLIFSAAGVWDESRNRMHVSPALVALALSFLLDGHWRTLTTEGVAALGRVLGDADETLNSPSFLSEADRNLFRWIFGPSDWSSDTKSYGIVVLHMSRWDWASSDGVDELPRSTEPLFGDDASILFFARKVIDFARRRTLQALRDCLSVAPDAAVLGALPRKLTALLPIDYAEDIRAQILELMDLTDTAFQRLMAERSLGGRTILRHGTLMHVQEGTTTHEQWKHLVADFPKIALMFWGETRPSRFSRGRPPVLDSSRGLDRLISRLLSKPVVLLAAPHAWGRLLEKAPRRQRELREAFLRAAQLPVREATTWGRYSPFVVDLPTEASLLPHLLTALIGSSYRFLHFSESESTRDTVAHARETIKTSDALAIARDTDSSPRVRAAACMLAILTSREMSQSLAHLLAELYRPEYGTWYATNLGGLIEFVPARDMAAARFVVGSVLSRTRSDFFSRKRLDSVLMRWRERSDAPVTSHDVATKWLRSEI